MLIDTSTILSVANRDFSCAARLADAKGKAAISKNHRLKYLLIDMGSEGCIELTDNEKLNVVAARIIKRFNLPLRSWQNDSTFPAM